MQNGGRGDVVTGGDDDVTTVERNMHRVYARRKGETMARSHPSVTVSLFVTITFASYGSAVHVPSIRFRFIFSIFCTSVRNICVPICFVIDDWKWRGGVNGEW